MEIAVKDINKAMQCVNVIATVSEKSELKTYGKDGQYVNLELMDIDDSKQQIKLTIFGQNVQKVGDVKVCTS